MSDKDIIFSSMEQTFTDQNFQAEVVNSSVPVMVDFWAAWCGPCRMMAPIIEEIANEVDGAKMKIGKLNVDENPATAGSLNIMSIPTFLIFKGGRVVDQMVGGLTKSAMLEKLNQHM